MIIIVGLIETWNCIWKTWNCIWNYETYALDPPSVVQIDKVQQNRHLWQNALSRLKTKRKFMIFNLQSTMMVFCCLYLPNAAFVESTLLFTIFSKVTVFCSLTILMTSIYIVPLNLVTLVITRALQVQQILLCITQKLLSFLLHLQHWNEEEKIISLDLFHPIIKSWQAFLVSALSIAEATLGLASFMTVQQLSCLQHWII